MCGIFKRKQLASRGQCLFLLSRKAQARKDWVLAKALGVREWKEAGKRKHWGDSSYCPSWSLSFLT